MASVDFIGAVSYDANDNPSYEITVKITGLDPSYEGNRYFEYENTGMGTIVTNTVAFATDKSSYSFTISHGWSQITYKLYYYNNGKWETAASGTDDVSWPPLRWFKWKNLKAGDTIQSSTGITAKDWNEFTARINQMRAHQGEDQHVFQQVKPGDLITAEIYNEAVTWIGRPEEDRYAPKVVAGHTLISAECFKNLAKDLNWYL